MSAFVRRYLFDPGLEELSSIEGVVIIDRDPPGIVTGAGAGTATLVGEFENGAFETPTEVFSGGDVRSQFGGFGYSYDGVNANHPCARGRKVDNQIAFEYWNGNGFIALANKKFRRLILCRVDTSVGSVQFTRLAFQLGSSFTTYDLEPAQILAVKLNGGGAVNATFSAAVATTNSAAGTYPSTFVGGESITYTIDNVTYTTTFLAADQTQAQVVARLNLTVGYTAFALAGGGVTSITGRIRGTSGNVRILSVSGALVTTATGFSPIAAVPGTGNVANIDQVTQAEVKTIVEAAVAGTLVDRDINGKLRVSNVSTPGTGTIEIDAATTADGLGFTESVVNSAATADTGGVIPAGTRVQTAGAVVFVTMQDIAVTAASAGPYTVKVRHATDDGTGLGFGVSTLTSLTGPIALGAFSVTNTLPVSAALTEAAIDAKYVTAINATKNISSVAKETNLIWSARGSNTIRSQLRSNAIDASEGGCFGRMAIISPPLNTLRATARSSSVAPGVGVYRNQRVGYAYPGVRTFILEIAGRGTAGGAGFTADGVVDVHYDSFVVSTCSQLNPEENPGQKTDTQSGVLGLEAGNADVQALDMNDYKAFKKAGIMAPRISSGVCLIQSGVTSVDPAVTPQLKNVSRRRMADFVQDSLAQRLEDFNKKLQTKSRRGQALGEADAFLADLKAEKNPANQRIDSYSINGTNGNTTTTIAAGLYRMTIKVKTLSSMDVIVLDTEVGESVTITEQQAA